ncbi:unnamed protein product, partial [Rotaria sordida]
MCQNSKTTVHIQITSVSFANSTFATVAQYYDVDITTYKLILRHQQVSFGLPSQFEFRHDQIEAPALGILKRYVSLSNAEYYIIYIQPQITTINITSKPQHCPHTSLLFENG